MSLPPPNGLAPFAEGIAAALNQNCNFWRLSRSASVIERKGIGWLSGLLIDPETSGGVLLSAGSMASQYPGDFRRHGLEAGRARLVRYTSEEAHRSIDKNTVLLGVGLENVRKVPADPDFRMRESVAAAVRPGPRLRSTAVLCRRRPTDDRSDRPYRRADPIPRAGELRAPCRRRYGALFVPSDRCQDEWRPGGQADSIALDPHKMLLARWEAGGLLVKDLQKLRRAFHFASSYRTVLEDPLLINFLEYGPELSRSFKAFQIGCSIQALGLQAFPHGD